MEYQFEDSKKNMKEINAKHIGTNTVEQFLKNTCKIF